MSYHIISYCIILSIHKPDHSSTNIQLTIRNPCKKRKKKGEMEKRKDDNE